MENWGIIGAGVVGRATGRAISTLIGEHVIYYDVDQTKLYAEGVSELYCGDEYFEDFVKNCHTIFICVPTPFNDSIFGGDFRAVERYAMRIAKIAKANKLFTTVVQRSTCEPGTANGIMEKIDAANLNGIEYVVMPEFLSEKTAFEDCLHPSRIVVGKSRSGLYSKHLDKLIKLQSRGCIVYETSYKDAESIKMLSNYMLSLYISFWNEAFLAGNHLCDDLDIVMDAVSQDQNLHNPKRVYGKAFGGKCLPKDTKALLAYAQRKKMSMPLLRATIQVNERVRREHGVRTESLSEMKEKGLL